MMWVSFPGGHDRGSPAQRRRKFCSRITCASSNLPARGGKAAREGLDRFLLRLALELSDRERAMVAPAKCSQAACVSRRGRVSTRSPRRSTNPAFSNGRGARRRPRHHHRPRQPRRRQDARWRSVFRPVPFGELRSGFSVSPIRRMGERLRQSTSDRRLPHSGHILELNGESLQPSKAGGGVKPNPPP
jgi:hypothetical protein